jgi:hypothetical protein
MRMKEVYTEDNTTDIDNISYERKFIQETTLQIQTIFHANERSLYRRQHYRYRQYFMRTKEVYTEDNTTDIDTISYERKKFIQKTILQIETLFHTNERSLYRRQHCRYRHYFMRTKKVFTEDNTTDIHTISYERKRFIQKTTLQI